MKHVLVGTAIGAIMVVAASGILLVAGHDPIQMLPCSLFLGMVAAVLGGATCVKE